MYMSPCACYSAFIRGAWTARPSSTPMPSGNAGGGRGGVSQDQIQDSQSPAPHARSSPGVLPVGGVTLPPALAVWLSALVLGLPWPPSWVLAGCELCSSQPDTYQQQLTAPRTNSLCWREVIADAAQVRPPPLHRHHRPRAATEGHYLILKEIMEKEAHQVFLLKVSNRIHKSTFCSSYLFWTVSSIIWATLQCPGRRSCSNFDPCCSCSSLKLLMMAPFKSSNTFQKNHHHQKWND